jgi:hypothetical protein
MIRKEVGTLSIAVDQLQLQGPISHIDAQNSDCNGFSFGHVATYYPIYSELCDTDQSTVAKTLCL